MCSGIFPAIFKTTKIAPVLKPGKSPDDPNNYRPVSNICSIGKLIERAQFEQIKEHMSKHNLINYNQHGGISNHSTTTCLIEIVAELNEAQEEKNKVAVLAIDMSSGYNMVNHKLLLEKCRLLSIGDETLFWLGNYLSNRNQYVDVCGERSPVLSSGDTGVIQGARSSGDLFLMFLNDLPDLNKRILNNIKPPLSKQFVDDVNSVIRALTNESLMEKTLAEYNRLEKILISHKMKINGEKTQLMCVKPDEILRDMSINISGTDIKHQPTIKILGLTLSEDLKYDEHLFKGKKSLIRSVNIKNALLKSLKPLIPLKNLQQVGNSLVNSTLLYAAPVWGLTTKSNIQKVQSSQMKVVRTITGKKWSKGKLEHRQTSLDSIGWPNVMQIITASSLNVVKKASCNQSSEGINNMFITNEPMNPRKGKAQLLTHNGPVLRPSTHFSSYGVSEYNNLPHTLRDKLLTSKQFKAALKPHTKTTNLLEKH